MNQDQLRKIPPVMVGDEFFDTRRSVQAAQRTGSVIGGVAAQGAQLLAYGGHSLVAAADKNPVRYRFSTAKGLSTVAESPRQFSISPLQRWLNPGNELRLRRIAKNMGIPMHRIGLVDTRFLTHNAGAGLAGGKGYVFGNFSRGVPEWVLAHELGHLKTMTGKRHLRDRIYGLPTGLPASWLAGDAIRETSPGKRHATIAAATLMASNRLPAEFSADYHAIRGLGGGLKTKDARRVLASYIAKRTPSALSYIVSAANPLAVFAGGRIGGARAARRLNQRMNTAATRSSLLRNADAGR